MTNNTVENKTKQKSKTFKFQLITPNEVLLDLELDKIVAKTVTGEVGILPNHADMVAHLAIAPLKYWYRGQEEFVAVMSGVLEVKNNTVTIISDFAQLGEEIDEAVANKEAQKAKAELEMLKNKDVNQRELVIAEYKLQRELMLLTTSQLRRSK